MKLRNLVQILFILAAAGALLWMLRTREHERAAAAPPPRTPAERLAVNLQTARGSKLMTESRSSLTEMKKALRQMDAAEAREWILNELATAEDFATQLDLTIGTDQNLEGWPSYRVFLMDMLYLVDPAKAAEKARELLQPAAKASADEWAVAMRNLARGSQSPEDTALLKTKTAEMLRNKEWRTKPSAGYLEAFDVIVHTQNTALAPDLLNLCEDRDQRGTRHAAFLTLDRLAMAKPAELLPELAEFAAKHPSSRLMVSNMVARADIRVPEQRQALENYLLDERRAPDELRAFASVFPNGNVSVSQNLLTRAPVLQGADLAAQDRVALETMTAWLEDPRFAKVREPLAEACKRLHGFVNGQRGSK